MACVTYGDARLFSVRVVEIVQNAVHLSANGVYRVLHDLYNAVRVLQALVCLVRVLIWTCVLYVQGATTGDMLLRLCSLCLMLSMNSLHFFPSAKIYLSLSFFAPL